MSDLSWCGNEDEFFHSFAWMVSMKMTSEVRQPGEAAVEGSHAMACRLGVLQSEHDGLVGGWTHGRVCYGFVAEAGDGEVGYV